MAKHPLHRFLGELTDFRELTQSKAESAVRELVRNGEATAEQAQDLVAELVERSRKNRARLVRDIDGRVREQLSRLRVATQADIARVERRIDALTGSSPAADIRKSGITSTKSASESAATEKPAAKKPAAKKPAAKKPAAKKPAAKKPAAKKPAAKKPAAKKPAAKKPAAKKPAAKTTGAGRSGPARARNASS